MVKRDGVERYKDAIIYTIRCKKDDSKIYVGSTTENITSRISHHRSASLKAKHKDFNPLYKEVNGDWKNWYIVLHEKFPCNDRYELLKRWYEVIREIGTINKI